MDPADQENKVDLAVEVNQSQVLRVEDLDHSVHKANYLVPLMANEEGSEEALEQEDLRKVGQVFQ